MKVAVGMKLSGGSGIARSAGPGGDGVRTMERGGSSGSMVSKAQENQNVVCGCSPFLR